MQTENIKPLLIYSASAGSGKTFSLVQDYLKLTLGDGVGAMNFAKILAMTFTNKAAWEMKERIIQALDELAYPERGTEKESQKAAGLLEATKKSTGLSSQKIRARSKLVLTEILHNYEDFNILTIDKFSLRLIRTFSRDLDLQENFEVTLDQNQLIEFVIDELLSKIGKEGEEEITQLTLAYAKSKLFEGESWDIRRELILFSKVLIKETDQKFVHLLLSKEFNLDTYKDIIDELDELNQRHSNEKMTLFNYFEQLNTTPEDYPYKQGSGGIYDLFIGLPNRKLIDFKAPGKRIQDTLEGSNIKPNHNVDARLLEDAKALYEFERTHYQKAFTLEKIRSNFYNLSLLKYISRELNDYKEKENIIGIFEFGKKIAELLKRENAPYIYERLGNRYNHYLLDEFQDTSRLQWTNLIPLIHESIAHGHNNLIVGDPKQAIYRFRNGLVEQFVALPGIYNPEEDSDLARTSSLFKQMGTKKALDHNYRSKEAIVTFNNSFFKGFIQALPTNFDDYYEDVFQIPAKKDGGVVEINFLREKTKNAAELIDKEFDFILEKTKSAIEDGFYPGDICILVRNKKEGKEYAKKLVANNYKIVSSDSLVVSSDENVKLCIDYLNLRRNTRNKALQMKFATSYFQHQGKDPVIALTDFWIDNEVGKFDFNSFVLREFGEQKVLFFPYENLYDLGARMLAVFGQSELKNPYLHHLMELFQVYDLQYGPDIRGFIEEWNAKLSNSTIQMPENSEAIKIMTIHKSKGLEFPIVILPRISWSVTPSKDKQFIETEDGELLYSNLSHSDVPDYIIEQYNLEYRQVLLDNLNLLYVAFTRPSERLYILLDTNLPSNKDRATQLNHLIAPFMESWDDPSFTLKNQEVIQFGQPTKKIKKDDGTATDYNFYPKNLTDYLWFPELALRDAETKEKEELNSQKRMGIQLHLALSMLENEESIEKTIQNLVVEGKIDKELSEEIVAISTKVEAFLSKQEFATQADKTLNEQEVLITETEFKRLDKLYIKGNQATVLDFKTGDASKDRNKHILQVINYCKTLQDIGFEKTDGYLLYTQNMELVHVTEN